MFLALTIFSAKGLVMKDETPKTLAAAAQVDGEPSWRELPWLDVTNFAIDCHFMENASAARDVEELRKGLSSDHFYGLACLYDDSRPAGERPHFVSEETYRQEYWKPVQGMLPAFSTALNIVRDIFWVSKIRYDSQQRIFCNLNSDGCPGAAVTILECIFDDPGFEPFRYAYKIIQNATAVYSTLERTADGGEFAYSLIFKVVQEAAVADKDRMINLRRYGARL
jgi:hypothetical protein